MRCSGAKIRHEGRRQLSAETGFELGDTIRHLPTTERGDRFGNGQNQAMLPDHLDEDLVREGFAVDQCSVAIEDDGPHARQRNVTMPCCETRAKGSRVAGLQHQGSQSAQRNCVVVSSEIISGTVEKM